MIAVASVIVPVFLLLFLGWWFRRHDFPGATFWPPAERLTYFVLFPCLIALSLATVQVGEMPVVRMIIAIVGPLAVMTVLVLLIRPLLHLSGPQFTSVYQGTVRMNTYVGLSIAFGLHENRGLAAAAIAIAAIVPFVNLTCVWALVHCRETDDRPKGQLWKNLAMNPLIIACLVGVLLNVTSIGKPPLLGEMAEILSRAALPLGLLAVGSAISFQGTKDATGLAILTSILKLGLLPLITWGFVIVFEVKGIAAFVAILFNALPTAPSAYILARQLGGDASLMASLITWQTLIALLTLPILLACLV